MNKFWAGGPIWDGTAVIYLMCDDHCAVHITKPDSWQNFWHATHQINSTCINNNEWDFTRERKLNVINKCLQLEYLQSTDGGTMRSPCKLGHCIKPKFKCVYSPVQLEYTWEIYVRRDICNSITCLFCVFSKRVSARVRIEYNVQLPCFVATNIMG